MSVICEVPTAFVHLTIDSQLATDVDKGWRPFGPKVVLDGVDIDLEQSPGGCPNSQVCKDVMEGWYNFLQRLRSLMDADSRKSYIIT